MFLRAFLWIIEKILALSAILGGIFCTVVFFKIGSTSIDLNERIELDRLANKITEAQARSIWWTNIGSLGGILIGVGLASIFLVFVSRWLAQVRRNSFSLMVFRKLRRIKGDEPARVPPYVLYLRPFQSTNSYRENRGFAFDHVQMVFRQETELERSILNGISRAGALVALGKPGEHLGGGRIKSTEEDWKVDITELALNANLIVCLPSVNPGTLWEITMIFSQDIQDKSVFIIPGVAAPAKPRWPLRLVGMFGLPSNLFEQKRWNELRNSLITEGIKFPDYKPGLIFVMLDKTKVKFSMEVDLLATDAWRKIAKELASSASRRSLSSFFMK